MTENIAEVTTDSATDTEVLGTVKKMKTPSVTDQLAAIRDTLLEVVARLDATDSRLESLETRGEAQVFSQAESKTRVTALPQSNVGHPPADAVQDAFEALQQRRADQAESNPRIPKTKANSRSDLRQRLKELEEQPVGSARMRLQDMKTKGSIRDFKIITPGMSLPNDINELRALITVDAFGVVLSTELG